MNNTSLAKKIKELRVKQNLSQEDLAEKSGLSLRTIQRVESGEAVPRGDTLKRLATALDINPQELAEEESNLRTDKTYLLLINFSALSFLIYPLLGAIVPLVIWLAKRKEIMHMDSYGKRILNFQISWLIVHFTSMTLFTSIFFTRAISLRPHEMPEAGSMIGTMQLMLVFQIIVSAYNVIMIVLNAIRCGNDNEVRYKPAIKFFG